MFKDTQIQILNGFFQQIAETDADIQPFEKTMTFEDGIDIEITKRAFCEALPQIDDQSYLKNSSKLYKVMKIKPYSDYLELWLYECERGAI